MHEYIVISYHSTGGKLSTYIRFKILKRVLGIILKIKVGNAKVVAKIKYLQVPASTYKYVQVPTVKCCTV